MHPFDSFNCASVDLVRVGLNKQRGGRRQALMIAFHNTWFSLMFLLPDESTREQKHQVVMRQAYDTRPSPWWGPQMN